MEPSVDRIDGKMLRRINDQVINSFKRDQLKRLVLFDLEINLDDFPKSNSYEADVLDLTERLHHENRIDDFIRSVAELRPRNQEFRAIARDLGIVLSEGDLEGGIELKVEFINSLLTSKEFFDSGLVYNPYQLYEDGTSPVDLQVVRIYLWMPYVSILRTMADKDRVAIAAICDVGAQEVHDLNVDAGNAPGVNRTDRERPQEINKVQLNLDWLTQDIYSQRPDKLFADKFDRFTKLLGEVFKKTLSLTMLIPEAILCRPPQKAKTKAKDRVTPYETLLSLVLLPLVVGHYRKGFRTVEIYRELVGEGDVELDAEIDGVIKKLMKVALNDKRVDSEARSAALEALSVKPFQVTITDKSQKEFFYIYSGRMMALAAAQHYNKNQDDLLTKLKKAFM